MASRAVLTSTHPWAVESLIGIFVIWRISTEQSYRFQLIYNGLMYDMSNDNTTTTTTANPNASLSAVRAAGRWEARGRVRLMKGCG